MFKYRIVFLAGVLAISISGCGINQNGSSNEVLKKEPATQVKTEEKVSENPPPDNVNEAGRIPVIMYHRIAESKSDYDLTGDAFLNELNILYEKGYRPISLNDYVAGNIDVPAGMSPIVITFDDGDVTQYKAIDEAGTPAPESALGIMEAFKKEHPDFNPQATFFVNGGVPFGQGSLLKAKIKYATSKGYWIGNHTDDHENLMKIDGPSIVKAVGKNAAFIESLTGKPVEALALPFGIRPKDPALMELVVKGSYESKAYENKAILNVGWQPELPAYCIDFNPHKINRVRCGSDESELLWWLEQMDQKEGYRYISDGDPAVVTVPSKWADKIDSNKLGIKKLRVVKE